MDERKRLIREMVIGILLKEDANEIPCQYDELKSFLAEALTRRACIENRANGISVFPKEHHLEVSDSTILLGVFLDLVDEKIITLGFDENNTEFPWFRPHSRALKNLKKLSAILNLL